MVQQTTFWTGDIGDKAAIASASPVAYIFTGIFAFAGLTFLIVGGIEISQGLRHGSAMVLLIVGIVFACLALVLGILLISGSVVREKHSTQPQQQENTTRGGRSSSGTSRLSSALASMGPPPPPYLSTSGGSSSDVSRSTDTPLTGDTVQIEGRRTNLCGNVFTGSLDHVRSCTHRRETPQRSSAGSSPPVDIPNALPVDLSTGSEEPDSCTPPLATSSIVMGELSGDSDALTGYGSLR